MASVYMKSNGTWVCQWIVGRSRDGKKIRDSRTFGTKDEAIAHKIHIEKAGGGAGRDSLGARWSLWIDEREALGVISGKTATGYRQYCSVWANLLGPKPFKKVTSADLSRALVTLSKTPTPKGDLPSPQTLKHYVTALRTFCNDLVKTGELVKSPALSLSSPTPPKQPRRAPTMDELAKLIAAAEKDARIFGLMPKIIRFAVNTGLRRGELLALRWGDIDLEQGTVHIERTVSQPGSASKHLVFKSPKSEAGVRTLPITWNVIDLLLQHRRQQQEQRLKAGPAWANNDLVFCNPLGEVLNVAYVSRTACEIRDAAGIPRDVLPLHGLRHFHLSAVLKGTGNDRAAAKKRAGHASFASTERYITPDLEQDRAAATAGSIDL